MAKLYAITAGEYSDYHIITLCSDREKAERLVRWYNRHEKFGEAEIEEYEDGEIIPDESVAPYEVIFDRDGRIRMADRCSPEWVIGENPIMECIDGKILVHVLATDEGSAMKIAAEKRAKYIAEKTGVV